MIGTSRDVLVVTMMGIFLALAVILIIAVAGDFIFRSQAEIDIGEQGTQEEATGILSGSWAVSVCLDSVPEDSGCLECQRKFSVTPGFGQEMECESRQTIDIEQISDMSQENYRLLGEVETKKMDVCVIISDFGINQGLKVDIYPKEGDTISGIYNDIQGGAYMCRTIEIEKEIRPDKLVLESTQGRPINRVNVTFYKEEGVSG